MSDPSQSGKLLLAVAFLIALTGLFLMLSGRVPLLGRLPADFASRDQVLTLHAPLATSLYHPPEPAPASLIPSR